MSVTIPRPAIAVYDQIYKRYPLFSWSITSPAGRVLTQAWLTLWDTLPHTSQTDAPAIAQGFIGYQMKRRRGQATKDAVLG